MDVALDSNDMSKVFSVMSNVEEYKKLPPKILPSLPKFAPGRIQREELSKLFGTVNCLYRVIDNPTNREVSIQGDRQPNKQRG